LLWKLVNKLIIWILAFARMGNGIAGGWIPARLLRKVPCTSLRKYYSLRPALVWKWVALQCYYFGF
jgi:hypothetical protein